MSRSRRSAEQQPEPLEFLVDRGLGLDDERSPLVVHRATLFYLDNQQLRITEMVRRFHQARHKIETRARRGGPAIYAVTADGVEKRWP